MYFLPAGGVVGEVEIKVSPITLYTKKISAHKSCDIQHVLKTVGFHQKYSDIKTPIPGLDFETCSAQPSVLPNTNH